MKTYVGIDPGKAGAVAIIFNLDNMPVFYDAEKLDLAELGKILVERHVVTMPGVFVLIEKVQVMPGSRQRRILAAKFSPAANFMMPVSQQTGEPIAEKEVGQGRVGILNYGIGYGKYLGMLTALSIPFAEIHPMTWKSEFNLIRKGKEDSILTAKHLYPSIAHLLSRKKDHGRAEALLLAEYARRKNM